MNNDKKISDKDIHRLNKLMEVYQIDDINELLILMKEDIKHIKYIQKLQRRADKKNIESDLSYSRIGLDNWK